MSTREKSLKKLQGKLDNAKEVLSEQQLFERLCGCEISRSKTTSTEYNQFSHQEARIYKQVT